MSMTDSDFVIRLHRTFKDTQHVYFLLEAALGGSLIQAGQSARLYAPSVEVLKDHPEIFVQDTPRGSWAAHRRHSFGFRTHV